MKKLFTLFAAMVTFVALNAQTVDYYIDGFATDMTGQTYITEINLSLTDNLSPFVVLVNNGPDIPLATDSVILDILLNGTVFGKMPIDRQYIQGLTADRGMVIGSQQPLYTAAQMTQAGLEGTFELCYTVRIVGTATDPVASNNTKCVTLKRGTTGISEVAEGEVNVYPNPATTVINIDNAEGAQISVFDLSGRMVSSVNSASAYQTIDASNLAEGMYIVRIANGDNVITKKINVVR